MNNLPKINPQEEAEKIQNFIKDILSKQKKRNVVIGVSGGIDSAAALYLLKNSIHHENIYILNMPYFYKNSKDLEDVINGLNLPAENIKIISIKPIVDSIISSLNIPDNQIRKGNVMARARMIVLYDFAKKLDALVCGTENKSEFHLGYFTRFGDEASDFEPIQYLYKTQVYELAKYLKVPQAIIDKSPSANLWDNQTDEDELGFSYEEADNVLYLYFDKKVSVEEIKEQGFVNAEKIIDFAYRNSYKHRVPYTL